MFRLMLRQTEKNFYLIDYTRAAGWNTKKWKLLYCSYVTYSSSIIFPKSSSRPRI